MNDDHLPTTKPKYPRWIKKAEERVFRKRKDQIKCENNIYKSLHEDDLHIKKMERKEPETLQNVRFLIQMIDAAALVLFITFIVLLIVGIATESKVAMTYMVVSWGLIYILVGARGIVRKKITASPTEDVPPVTYVGKDAVGCGWSIIAWGILFLIGALLLYLYAPPF